MGFCKSIVLVSGAWTLQKPKQKCGLGYINTLAKSENISLSLPFGQTKLDYFHTQSG